MVSTSRETRESPQSRLLSEAARIAPFGTILGWRTPQGSNYGIVLGREGNDFLCLTIYDRNLRKESSLKFYRDEALSDKLAPLMPGVLMSVQRVPGNRAFRHGLVKGAALRPYMQAAAHLQLEGTMYTQAGRLLREVFVRLDEEMWIQKAVKKPGRLPKILGIKADEWEDMEKGAKLKAIDAKLKALEGDSGKAAKSMRGALTLGKRFIGGSIGKKIEAQETLDGESLEERTPSISESVRWVRQKYGAKKAAAHREFLRMVRKDPAAHRRKMRTDKIYHQKHKWHDHIMRRTARTGWKRSRHEGLDERDPGQSFMDLPFELRVTERGLGLGPGGHCVCPACGHSISHDTGEPCLDTVCPKCGVTMIREESSPESMQVQTLIFSKDTFTRKAAIKWALTHGFKVSKVDEKENTLRLRQRDPEEFEVFRTIEFKPGLKAVVAKQ